MSSKISNNEMISLEALEAVEAERAQIARYLHDEVAQFLVVSNNRLTHNPSEKDIKEISAMISKALDKIRGLVWELDITPRMDLLLQDAIEDSFREIINSADISFIDDGLDKPVDNIVKMIILQSVRELFFNIVKHAEASSVYVTVERNSDFVRVIVEDNGKGSATINPPISKNGGFGLRNIIRNFESIGGSIEIKSREGVGTRIELNAPLNPRSEE